MGVMTEPCGGCGESNPKKACIGCLHFQTADHAERSPYIAEIVEGEVRTHVSADPTLPSAPNQAKEAGE